MDELKQERMVTAIERTLRAIGTKDYETGIKQAARIVEYAKDAIAFVEGVLPSIQSIEGLCQEIDWKLQVSPEQEDLVLFIMEHFLEIMRVAIEILADRAASGLPHPNVGRPPAFTASQSREILDSISKAIRDGLSISVAKLRASQKYDCSKRSIDRLWSNRASVPKNDLSVEIVVKQFLNEIDFSQGWPK